MINAFRNSSTRFESKAKMVPLAIAGFIALLTCAGCGGPDYVQVSGTVLVDGQPTQGVALFFRPISDDPNAFPASTISGDGGAFSLTTNMVKGLPAGTYKIAATYPDPNFAAEPVQGFGEPEPPPDLFAGKYTGKNAALTQEIKESTTDFKIELTTGGK